MSRSRERSWKKERKVNKGRSRRIGIVLLIGSLIVLLAILFIPWLLPKEPPLQFICVVSNNEPGREGQFSDIPETRLSANETTLSHVFHKLHELNTSRVRKPETVTTENLKNINVNSKDKLLLYCGLEAAIEYDSDRKQAILVLKHGVGANSVPFSEFLSRLSRLDTSLTVLMLDIVERDLGVDNGQLGEDLFPLIQSTIQDADNPRLVVICSHSSGERSWEYIPDPNDAIDSLSEIQSEHRLFAGTVFARKLANSCFDELKTLKSLYEFLQSDVSSYVQEHYRAEQTVSLLLPGKSVLDRSDPERELLANLNWPKPADFQSSESPSDPAAPVQNAEETAVAPSDSELEDPFMSKRLAELDSKAVEMFAAGEVAALFPRLWTDLNLNLSAARIAVLYGDVSTVMLLVDAANKQLAQIEAQQEQFIKNEQFQIDDPWLISLLPDPDSPPDVDLINILKLFERDPAAELPRPLRTSGPDRDVFARKLITYVSGANDDAERSVRISLCREMIKRLALAGWSKEDWPQEFFTIQSVVSVSDVNAGMLNSMSRLNTLRNQTLMLAVGRLPEGRFIHEHSWQNSRAGLNQILTKLVAAESWLAIGKDGQEQASELLDQADKELRQLQRKLSQDGMFADLESIQSTLIPLLIQFLAQEQEEVSLGEKEFKSAMMMAEVIREGNTTKLRSDFPSGLLGQNGIDTEVVNAMFALSKNYSIEPITEKDLEAFQLLSDFVIRRTSETSSLTEGQRLIRLLGTGAVSTMVTPKDLIQRLMKSSENRGLSQSSHSGIWMSFWSIRLLTAITREEQTKLWTLWQQLVQNVSVKDEHTSDVRALLAGELLKSWQSLPEKPIKSSYVSTEEMTQLLANEISRRNSGILKDPAFSLIQKRFGNKATGEGTASISTTSDDAVILDETGRAQIGIQANGGKGIFLSRGNYNIESPADVKILGKWYQLLETKENPTVTLKFQDTLYEPVPVVCALVDENSIVKATHVLNIFPNPKTEWELELLTLNGEPLTLRNGFKLPPTTRNPEDGKDLPIPLRVRLIQKSGVAKSIAVQCLLSDETPIWTEPQQLTLDPKTQSVEIPFTPQPMAGSAAENAAPASYNVLDGFSFKITPLGLNDAVPTQIRVQPIFSQAAEYATVPSPVFDHDTRQLTFRIEAEGNVSALRPPKLPVQVHFSPALERLLVKDGTPITLKNIPAEGYLFRFTFATKLQQAFDADDLEDDANNLEFGMSVAGIPHAWRWRLTKSGVVRLNNDEPAVRLELKTDTSSEAKPVADVDELLFGKDWKTASLNAELMIYGGYFDRQDDPQWQLGLLFQKRASTTKTPLMEPIPLTSRWQESIQMGSGQKGHWYFSTHTDTYRLPNIQVGQAGRFDMIAQVKPMQGNDEPFEYRVPFVFDETAPELDEDLVKKLPDRHLITKELSAEIKASDIESGIASIRVGMNPAELLPTQPGGKFVLKPIEFPIVANEVSAKGTLYIEVTNHAGLITTHKQTIEFYKTASPPTKLGAVVFQWSPPSSKSIIVKLNELKGKHSDSKGGKTSVTFENVPPGEYEITWVPGPKQGKRITVLAGKTITVDKDEPAPTPQK